MTDQELVKESLRTPNAYAAIVEKYEGAITHFVKRLLYGSPEDTEDVVQEVFITAYRYLNSYNSKYSFSSWLYRIGHNKAVDYLRKQGTKNLHSTAASALEQEDANGDSAFEQIADEVDTEQLAEQEITKQKISDALQKIDTKSRTLLILKYFEEKDYQEISDIMKLPAGTVASYIHRAKDKLKKVLHHE
jgi:RNA polymerase sigma-70 factor (ECF subfamily)